MKPVNITAAMLRTMAEDDVLVIRTHLEIEDRLVALRDAGFNLTFRANGLVIREYDRTPSSAIRIGTADAIRLILTLIADYLEKEDPNV